MEQAKKSSEKSDAAWREAKNNAPTLVEKGW